MPAGWFVLNNPHDSPNKGDGTVDWWVFPTVIGLITLLVLVFLVFVFCFGRKKTAE